MWSREEVITADISLPCHLFDDDHDTGELESESVADLQSEFEFSETIDGSDYEAEDHQEPLDSEETIEQIRILKREIEEYQCRNLMSLMERTNKLVNTSKESSLKCRFIQTSFRTLSEHSQNQATNGHLKSLNKTVWTEIRGAIEASQSLMILESKDDVAGEAISHWKKKIKKVHKSMEAFHQELLDSSLHQKTVHEQLTRIVTSFQKDVIKLGSTSEIAHDSRKDPHAKEHISKYFELLKTTEGEAMNVISLHP